jgi:hypothetical protein
MKKITIQDDNGNDYTLQDLAAFQKHIVENHCTNGKPNGSTHVENWKQDDEHRFTITQEFYDYVMQLNE